MGGARGEVNRRHVDGGEDASRVRGDELEVVRDRERARPGVEELDDVGTRPSLRGDVAGEGVGELLQEAVPDVRRLVHARLRPDEVARRTAFDEVAGDRERPAGEADDGPLGSRSRRTSWTASSSARHGRFELAVRSRSTSACDRIGDATTGPTPSTSSTSIPMPRTGSMMSANITAASTSYRRSGWSVTSAQSSGCPQISKSVYRSRIARYSGSERPAWRMNQTGVRSTRSRRQARTRSGSTTFVD